MRFRNLLACLAILFFVAPNHIYAQEDHSIARRWNEELLHSIRNDFARPTVHARNLWHTSVAMYDLWAVYDSIAQPYFLGNDIDGFTFQFDGIPPSSTPREDLEEAISYAMYNLLFDRFITAPGAGEIILSISNLMEELGYDVNYFSTDYSTGDPAALGNYIAEQIIEFGLQDGSNQQFGYENLYYESVNDPLVMDLAGAGDVNDPNRWQALSLEVFIDQAGNEIPGATQDFLSPEWGQVVPFALDSDELTVYNRDNFDYLVYHDPGDPPYIDLNQITAESEEFKWGFALVSVWSAHLDPDDGVMWDISPGASGNLESLPENIFEYKDYYELIDGGVPTPGHDVNPHTGLPYEPNLVPRGDYTRVLAEFWADGPDSETPPGHWFTLLNYVNDHPDFARKYGGIGQKLDALEWDVKAYMVLGGAMHDCAISAWGIKGWYDYLRPVSAIRQMADRGQCTDSSRPNFDPAGIPLIDGYIELVEEDDPLVGQGLQNLYKIKLKAWRGPDFIDDPEVDDAGVGWILAERWWPYQRPSFVSPPFAGYISGHSTFSRAAAEVLTALTGDAYFPGGMGEFIARKNEFLVFEEGPSEDVVLQWATYRDASDQTSLSRIWGGIHPPADDIPGRKIGIDIAEDAVSLAEQYFFKDEDMDGYYNYVDCDDNNANVNPGLPETCDGLDNNCSGEIDEGLTIYTYYLDSDGDGFGEITVPLDTCLSNPPTGFVLNNLDCNDLLFEINPDSPEVCDGIDNNCSGEVDEGLPLNRYYFDADEDGYGDASVFADTCISFPPAGFVINDLDCNDTLLDINPDSPEVCDGIDNNCDGRADEGLPKNRYYLDFDGDGYGNENVYIDTCIGIPPTGFVSDFTDCNDDIGSINPGAQDIADNGIDEDCSGLDYFQQSKVFPNPFTNTIWIHLEYMQEVELNLYSRMGRLVFSRSLIPDANRFNLDLTDLPEGVYYFRIIRTDNEEELYSDTVIKLNY